LSLPTAGLAHNKATPQPKTMPSSRSGPRPQESAVEESFFAWMRMWAASSLRHHLLGASDEIGREVAPVGLHPLDDVESSVSAILKGVKAYSLPIARKGAANGAAGSSSGLAESDRSGLSGDRPETLLSISPNELPAAPFAAPFRATV
jgi:hypothetical protein